MGTIKIKDIIAVLESFAPVSYQEDYDNSGLLTGHPEWDATGILVTLDCVEEIVDEAIANNCNVIVAHHPILFKGLKRITGKTYVERCLIKAIKHDVAIYAIHTNLDNVHTGVSREMAVRIGLKNLTVLAPKSDTLLKLVTFIPSAHVEEVMAAIHAAGAGNIGDYKQCSFRVKGTGTFLPTGDANPHTGSRGKLEQVEEMRVEVILPKIGRAHV